MPFSSTLRRPNAAPRKSRGNHSACRLLAARVGGIELRLRGEQVGPALEQRRRLSGLATGGAIDGAVPGHDARPR